jgi:PAS domain S-box-containing protein
MAHDNPRNESAEPLNASGFSDVESSRIIAETASDAIITIDEKSTIVFVNRAAGTIFGYSPEEMLGAQLTMLMPEYLRHLHRAGLKHYIETGHKHISWDAAELPGLHKSGKEISLELSFGEFRRNGQRFFTGIARDVTRRKRDERRLTLQHAITGILADAKSLAEATPKILEEMCKLLNWQVAAFWSVDSQRNEMRCVANWRHQASDDVADFEKESKRRHFSHGQGLPGKIWERKEPIWVADFAADRNFPRSPVAARANLHSAFGFPIFLGGEVFGVIELFTEEIRHADPASLETLAGIGSQMGQFIERKNLDEKRVGALASAHEARVEAEALTKRLASLWRITDAIFSHLSIDDVISESLNRIREVMNVDTVAVLLLRTEGDELVAWAAQGLEEEVEMGVRVPVGKGFAGRVIQQQQPIIIEDVSQADVYNPLLRQKGIKSLLGVPLFAEGRPTGVLHVGKLEFTHFTEDDVRLLQLAADRIALAIENARLYQVERNARGEAESANLAKDEFLTVLSHELRTPLTPIIGWVHIMQQGILSEPDSAKALSVIDRNAYTLTRLINDLLDMSAILSGKMRIEETQVLLAAVLEDSVETMRPFARDSKVTLKLEIDDDAAATVVKGDRSRLIQTFCNILHNAIKFSPAGEFVEIAYETSASEAIIRIKDHGEGISIDFLPHVFERFRQADSSRTRAYGGLGLGLALVKSFVDAHGGTIEATSEGHGEGSVFTIRLPREDSPGEKMQEAEHENYFGNENPIRILIVEDQPDTLEMLAANFQTRGYETVLCTSAAQALQTADREDFDILISDIAMPSMDGLQLITDLRKRNGLESIPAIALSGYASQKDVDMAINAGFDLHLSKPVDPAELTAAVENLTVERSKQKG